MRIFLIFFCVLASFFQPAYAAGKDPQALPLPRFASLKTNEVFMRTGPAQRYPIKWTYKREQLPVEIIQEFDAWRKIKDKDGEEGWVHQSMLSGRRSALVTGKEDMPVLKDPQEGGQTIARMEPGVIVMLDQCNPTWCKVKAGGFKGWMQRTSLWGIYESEVLN